MRSARGLPNPLDGGPSPRTARYRKRLIGDGARIRYHAADESEAREYMEKIGRVKGER